MRPPSCTAQPSLSRQIQFLEHDLSVLLFVRSDKGVQLTEAGLTLQERAKAILHQVRQLRDEVGQHANAARRPRLRHPAVAVRSAHRVTRAGLRGL